MNTNRPAQPLGERMGDAVRMIIVGAVLVAVIGWTALPRRNRPPFESVFDRQRRLSRERPQPINHIGRRVSEERR